MHHAKRTYCTVLQGLFCCNMAARNNLLHLRRYTVQQRGASGRLRPTELVIRTFPASKSYGSQVVETTDLPATMADIRLASD